MEETRNVILINGSPNRNGCTFTALNQVARELEREGISTEIIHVGNREIRGCIACRACRQKGCCVFDDIVNEVAPKLAACDGIVVGSPVYYASANGTLTAFLDRLFYSCPADKTMKVGAAVVSARRGVFGDVRSAQQVLYDLRNAHCGQPVLEQRTRQYPRGSHEG